jgi:protein-S-isoprenylcysteine O-methyltransferase Ste14
MRIEFQFLPTIVFATVMLSWFVFAGIFLLRKHPPSPPDQKRATGSLVGVGLQGVSYALVWTWRRAFFTPMFPGSRSLEIVLSTVAIVLAIGSGWMCNAAVSTLGKEWSITARLVEGHKLVTSGPYARVRHPIYTGMLGMLIATGLAVSHWIALVIAIVIFFIGTIIRVRSEERLLRGAFGSEFESYAQRVAAIIPGIY